MYSILCSLPALYSILYATAKLIFIKYYLDHITVGLYSLQWLPIAY